MVSLAKLLFYHSEQGLEPCRKFSLPTDFYPSLHSEKFQRDQTGPGAQP